MPGHVRQKQNLASLADQELVERIQARDEAVLTSIYDTHYDRIYRYMLVRVGQPEDAAELAAEVFVRMLGNVTGLRWRGITLSAWLFRLAHNLTVEYLRDHAGPDVQMVPEMLARSVQVGHGHDVAAQLPPPDSVQAALRRLPPLHQEVLQLRFASGMSVAETARILGKNEGAVKVLQYNAMAILRRLLGSIGGMAQEGER